MIETNTRNIQVGQQSHIDIPPINNANFQFENTINNINRDLRVINDRLNSLEQRDNIIVDKTNDTKNDLYKMSLDNEAQDKSITGISIELQRLENNQDNMAEQLSILAGSLGATVSKVTDLYKHDESVKNFWSDIIKNIVTWALIGILSYFTYINANNEPAVAMQEHKVRELENKQTVILNSIQTLLKQQTLNRNNNNK